VRVFKSKEFAHFTRSERISDRLLCDAIKRADRGLIDADLGAGLIKQRVPRPGQGRSSGFRTLIVYRASERSVFVYGFAKNEHDNIGDKEQQYWRRVAGALLGMDEAEIANAVSAGELMEITPDD
jgi:hypothetical protein